MNITQEIFGQAKNGEKALLFTLINNKNTIIKITNYGGIINSILVPDKNGKIDDIVLGLSTFSEYQAGHPYLGALVGRFGNRIAKGRFCLNGIEYKLAINDGENHLHGGLIGFDKVIWAADEFKNLDEVGIVLNYLSKDMEEGYPGNLRITVKYSLNDQNELTIRYEAITDKPTVINLTNHSYFNLCGEGSGNVLGHEIMINADQYTVVNDSYIPSGEIRKVKGSPMDFITPYQMGSRIDKVVGGYDHNYVLNKKENELAMAAKVYEPDNGRIMEVFTTQPGIQFYTGNFLEGSIKGKSGKYYQKYAGFCLETQHFPDSPNHPDFPTTVLNPGEIYKQVTIYKFSV